MSAPQCPPASRIPQLTIDRAQTSAVPAVLVEDDWQIYFSGLDGPPISDAQLVALARNDTLIDRMAMGMKQRGVWTYLGMSLAVLGGAVSSGGWILFGQNQLPRSVTTALGLGGLIVGVSGGLLVTHVIQTTMEPYLAPTPAHRLSRDEARTLVSLVNRRWYDEICAAATERP